MARIVHLLNLLVLVLSAAGCQSVFAEIYTSKGVIIVRLEHERTPLAVSNFVGLAEGTIENAAFPLGRPFYDGSSFHRVVPGHVIQGGSPDSESSGGPGYQFANEIVSGLSHDHAGALGMANGGPHTNSSQFYITLGDRSYLDGDYTVFGEVVEGMEVVNAIERGDAIERIVIRRGRGLGAFHPDSASFEALRAAAEARVAREDEARRARDEKWAQSNWPAANLGPDGDRHLVLRDGTGDSPVDGVELTLRYAATTPTGFAFRSTSDGRPHFGDEGEEFTLALGSRGLPDSLQLALKSMSRGEKRLVVLPPDLAYGTGGHYGPNVAGEPRFVIHPNTAIAYELELIDF